MERKLWYPEKSWFRANIIPKAAMKQPETKPQAATEAPPMTGKEKGKVAVGWCLKRLSESRLMESAGGISFTVLLNIVPMLALFLAIFTQFPVFGTLKGSLESYFAQGMMPENVTNIILKYLNRFVANAGKVSLIGGIALLFSLYTSLSALENAFNSIWGTTSARPWHKRLSLYLFLGMLVPISVGSSLYITSHVILAKHGFTTYLPFIGGIATSVCGILWTAFAFSLFYRILPNRLVQWRDALAGGVFAAVAFEIAIRGFAFYMLNFNFYEKVYGTLAAFPIFIMWIYICTIIVLLGAFTAAILPEIRNGSWNEKVHPGKHFFDVLKVIGVLNKPERKTMFSPMSDIVAMTHLSGHEVEYAIGELEKLGWVQSPQEKTFSSYFWARRAKTRWQWCGDGDRITLATIFEECVFTGNHEDILADEIKRIIDHEMDISLNDYFSSPYAITEKLPPPLFGHVNAR
ncbi:MAG: YihY family inner membrane protein [Oxalobacter sp.]|nr:YihY family inner membrane protein [Oxalobacter sp.]